MKKRICFLLCLLLSLSAFTGCGGTTETPKEEQQAQEEVEGTEEAEADTDTFAFTVDEFVSAVDENLTERERKLLSEYELVEEENKLMYKLTDTTSLMIQKNVDNEKIEGMIFYETLGYLSDEEIADYTALLIGSLAVIDPNDLQTIVEDLNLLEIEEGVHFAEGTNAKYIYEVKDGVAKVSALPAETFQ